MSDYKNLDTDINFGNMNFVSVKSNLIVQMNDTFVLYDTEGAYELMIEIRADLETVPEKYREVFLNMLTSKYFNKTNFADNPFVKPFTPKKDKWWKKYINNLNFF